MSGFKAFTAGEVAQNNTGIQVAKAMSWATSGIALFVGAIGVMNTVLMSVFERLHEIGILLAIGWRRSRILRMVLYESIMLGAAGGILGSMVGTVAVKLLEKTPLLHGKIEGEFSIFLFALALSISIGLGALGGLYPAIRGSRMHPSEALRYE
jgi:putative ABC transport system permease protein